MLLFDGLLNEKCHQSLKTRNNFKYNIRKQFLFSYLFFTRYLFIIFIIFNNSKVFCTKRIQNLPT